MNSLEPVMELTPVATYSLLLFVQAAHLLHHRLAKRHISFVEVVTGMVLCVPPTVAVTAWLMMGAHLTFVVIQLVGSVWIDRLSPRCDHARQTLHRM